MFLLIDILFLSLKPKWLKKALNLSFNVFSTKGLIGDTIFTSPTGDETTILRGQHSQAKVLPLAVQREYPHFSLYFKTLSIGPVPGIEPAISRCAINDVPIEQILPRFW